MKPPKLNPCGPMTISLGIAQTCLLLAFLTLTAGCHALIAGQDNWRSLKYPGGCVEGFVESDGETRYNFFTIDLAGPDQAMMNRTTLVLPDGSSIALPSVTDQYLIWNGEIVQIFAPREDGEPHMAVVHPEAFELDGEYWVHVPKDRTESSRGFDFHVIHGQPEYICTWRGRGRDGTCKRFVPTTIGAFHAPDGKVLVMPLTRAQVIEIWGEPLREVRSVELE